MRLASRSLTMAALVLLAGCGTHPVNARTGFDRAPGDTSVAQRFGSHATGERLQLTIPAGTQHLAIHLDCVHDTGEVQVSVVGQGAASTPCHTDAESPALIVLGVLRALPAQSLVAVVKAPAGSSWSVGIDAGRGRSAN